MSGEENVVKTILDFLREIGILIEESPIADETVLPGISLIRGGLRVDRATLLYPGDLLHEAGHLAVMTEAERAITLETLPDRDAATKQGDEIVAIAWSYAAIVHLGIDPAVLFHPNGYNGHSDWFIEQYTSGNFIGLPLLQWMGLCYDEKNAALHQSSPYPTMRKWLRE